MKNKKRRNQNSIEDFQKESGDVQRLTDDHGESIVGGHARGPIWCVQHAKDGIAYGDSFFSNTPPNGITTVASYHCGEIPRSH